MKDGVHMGIFNFLFDTLKNDMKETYVLHDLLKPEETNEKPLLRDIQDFTYKKKRNAQVLKITEERTTNVKRIYTIWFLIVKMMRVFPVFFFLYFQI